MLKTKFGKQKLFFGKIRIAQSKKFLHQNDFNTLQTIENTKKLFLDFLDSNFPVQCHVFVKSFVKNWGGKKIKKADRKRQSVVEFCIKSKWRKIFQAIFREKKNDVESKRIHGAEMIG